MNQAQPIVRAPKLGGRAVLLAVAVLVVAVSLTKLPNVYVAFHEWRFNRLSTEWFADTSKQNLRDWADFHRDQLVSVGAYEEVRHTFSDVESTSPKAKAFVKKLISGECPHYIEWSSPAGKAGSPLEVEILCRPEDTQAWNNFLKKEAAR
jgi:hypothetical protein